MAARNLFSPHPQQHTSSPGDAGEEQQLLAQTVNAITLALAGAILLSFISSFLFGGVRPNTLLIDLVMLLVTLVVRRLLSIQQIRPATILLIAAIFPLITILLIGVGTVRTPAASAYIILVILAGIIFELRGAVVTALLASLAVFGLIWAEQAGRLPPAAPFTSYLQGLTYAVSFCLAGALSNYILRLIRRALDRSRQDITERKQAERLQEAVYRIAAAALEAETLQALYPQIHHHIAEVMYASNFYIALYDEPSDQIRFVYFADEYDQLDEGPIAPGSGLTARVLHSHQPLLYRLDQDPQGFGAELIGTPCRVWLGVPLMVHDRCLGVMTVQHYSDPLAFTLREQRILEYVSTQVATAIDRKRSEEAIRQVERRSQAMIENAPDGILILDQAGALQYASPSALRLFGYPAAEVLGSSVFGYAHPDDLARMLTGMRNVLRDPTISHPIEYRMRHKHGHYIWTEITTKNLLAEPSVQGVVINFRDITERKLAGEQLQRSQAELAALNAELEQRVEARTADLRQSEQSLRRSRDALSASNAALEKANRLKDEFLASMSHELRTPLTGILGLAEALQMQTYGEMEPRQLKALHAIEDSGRHLLDLINDILDLSKIEANKLELQLNPVSVNDLCLSSLQLVQSMAQKKQQQLTFSIDSPFVMVEADPRRFKQVLVNLLSNAIKFTPERGALGVEVISLAEQEALQLTVWDHGIGIRAEDTEKLFKPFVQLDGRLARQYSGTGLGLSLVWRLTEMHGGSVRLESEPGQGSRFSIVLPWPQRLQTFDPAGGSPAVIEQTGAQPARVPGLILLADDNEPDLEDRKTALERVGHQVLPARSDKELIDLTLNECPDLLLIDVQMPGIDGLQTIQKLRAACDTLIAGAPIVALSALALPGDEARYLQAGANRYVCKPLSTRRLTALVDELLVDHAPASQLAQP